LVLVSFLIIETPSHTAAQHHFNCLPCLEPTPASPAISQIMPTDIASIAKRIRLFKLDQIKAVHYLKHVRISFTPYSKPTSFTHDSQIKLLATIEDGLADLSYIIERLIPDKLIECNGVDDKRNKHVI
jgi:hypothetical protein